MQEIIHSDSFRIFKINYDNYQEVANQMFPKTAKIKVVEKNKETQINIEYRNVSLNQELRYPFKIPDNYKEISIE